MDLITKSVIPMELIIISPNDYSKLEFVDFNRDVDSMHIKELKESIQKYGFLTPVIVIRNDDRFTVIDGQHRTWAAMELQSDIPITVLQDIELDLIPEIIAKLNTSSKRWQMVDYFRLYVKMGKPEYLWLEKFMNKTSITLRESLYLWSYNPLKNMLESKSDFKSFKVGSWSPSNINKDHINNLVENMSIIKAMIANKDIAKSHTFSDSLMKVMLHPKFDLEKMIANADHYNYGVLPSDPHIAHFEGLVSLYNKSASGRLTFNYEVALDGTVATNEKELQTIRDNYVNIEQFSSMSPYTLGTLNTNKKLQPANGIPDVYKGLRKYWEYGKASAWARVQHSRRDTSIKDTHKIKPEVTK